MNAKLLKTIFTLLFLLVILYILRVEFYLSWTTWWFDLILHFIASCMAGVVVVFLLQRFFEVITTNQIKIILLATAGALVVGIVWEIYELYFGQTFLSDGIVYITDTASDLIMDICGGFLGALYAGRFISKQNE